ncbi:MAG: insulinase family protein [Cyclobacteriaceae bacterium]|nr:insulinase family protein [Cyclobacteriaceae bacterium]
MKELHRVVLPNGIRLVYQQVDHTQIVHCGVFLDVGSRDESEATQGLTHFWEHMAFKGTRKRKAFQIINSIDSVGGELNAYTDKEKVVFFASVRDQYFERSVDVLADITFNSVFPEPEIEKERGVILQEMAMYLDNPDDSLQDEFESVIYGKHPMGMNILGRQETVSTFRRADFKEFFKQRMDTKKIVFSCVGNLAPSEVEETFRKYFSVMSSRRTAKRKPAGKYKPQHKELIRPVKQAKCAIGRPAYPVHHNNRIPFYLLVNMLGGPGMNSRLNMALRERYGYVYSIDAHYISYTDTGMFAVFFGTKPNKLERCITLVQQELDKFKSKPLNGRQLKAAKEQLKGQMAMAEENNQNMMMLLGRSTLDLDRVPSLQEVFEIINETDSATLRRIAEEMFDADGLSFLKMIPT